MKCCNHLICWILFTFLGGINFPLGYREAVILYLYYYILMFKTFFRTQLFYTMFKINKQTLIVFIRRDHYLQLFWHVLCRSAQHMTVLCKIHLTFIGYKKLWIFVSKNKTFKNVFLCIISFTTSKSVKIMVLVFVIFYVLVDVLTILKKKWTK